MTQHRLTSFPSLSSMRMTEREGKDGEREREREGAKKKEGKECPCPSSRTEASCYQVCTLAEEERCSDPSR